MAGLLDKVAKRAPAADPRKPKETLWRLTENHPLNAVMTEANGLIADAALIEGKLTVAKIMLKEYAEQRLLEHVAEANALPSAPIKILSATGLTAGYVVQERAAAVKPDQVEALQDLFGESNANALLRQQTSFGLNSEILEKPGVRPVIERALESALKKLVKDEVLQQSEADDLIEAKTTLRFVPGVLDQGAKNCGSDPGRMRQFLDAIGSTLTRYITL